MTFLLFFIALLVLILVHEWGHFYAARKLGVRVDEFGFGFPPKLGSITRGGTNYVFNLFPIGGYVKIYGESGEGSGEHQSFSSRPIWQRFVIVFAGVFMNFVLAWVLLTGAHFIGISRAVEDERNIQGAAITIIGVEAKSPAEEGGIKFGDTVTALTINGVVRPIETIPNLQQIIKENGGKDIGIILKRGSQERELHMTPRENPAEGSGPLGIALEYVKIVRSPWYRAPLDGLNSLYETTIGTVQGLYSVLKNIVVSRTVSSDISGPVGIFVLTKQVQELGLSYILQFVAILSINLAILNSLPIPALDGGRIFFMLIEKIRRRAVSAKFEAMTHTIGFVLLLILMILVTIRDVGKFF